MNLQMLTCASCGGLTPPNTSRDCVHCDAPLPQPPRWARRLSALLGPAGAILLAACYGGPGRYYSAHDPRMPAGATRLDRDHDGALGPYECAHAGYSCMQEIARLPAPADLDCNDKDPSQFPGGADVAGDGVDSNCDGVDGWADSAQSVQPPATDSSPPATVAVPPSS